MLLKRGIEIGSANMINWLHKCRMAIRPVLAGTVPFFGLGPGVRPSLPLCPGIFDSKFAFINKVHM